MKTHPDKRKPGIAPILGDVTDPRGFPALVGAYLEAMRIRGFTETTLRVRMEYLRMFVSWCLEREIRRPMEVTKPILDRYQRWLYQRRREDGRPLSFRTQHGRLTVLRALFRWLTKQSYLLANPASEIELPRLEKRLPGVLALAEMEAVLAVPDVNTVLGLRDRAVMETMYSTGMRRMEAVSLGLYDIDVADGTVMIRQGKGRKDRVVPIGRRALEWIDKYLNESRPRLAMEPDEGRLFLTKEGEPFHPNYLSYVVAKHVKAAEIHKQGGCHLFRHTMATLMLEGGADIRFIQQMLGHSRLDTTEIYTHVSIRKLKEIHEATHPGAKLGRPGSEAGRKATAAERDELASMLAADVEDEAAAGGDAVVATTKEASDVSI